MNYIRWTLPFKRNGVICLPIFIAWRTWGLKIIEGWYWNLTRKRKTEKKLQFCSESSSRRSKWKLRISSPPSPDSVTCNQAFNPANSPFCATWKWKFGLSENKSISALKTFWKVAYEKSIPNQYEPVRDLPFPWKKVSLRIDSLPTDKREMLASIPSLRAMNRDCLAVRNPWGMKG